jgi:branched-chain amino acid transport system substrate-binding protein
VLLAGALILVAGCGTGRAPAVSVPGLSAEELARADRLMARLQQEHSLHRDRKTLELAFELLDRYADYPRNDEAMLLAVRSARRLGDLATGLRLVDEFRGRYAASDRAPEVLSLGAGLAAARGDTLAAADLAMAAHDRLPAGDERGSAADRAGLFLERLSADGLSGLFAGHGQSDLRPYVGYLRVRALQAEGRPAEAELALDELRAAAPGSEWLGSAEQLLAEPGAVREGAGPRGPSGPVTPTRVGILCPLTGRYAVLGNAFYDGALLALQKVNSLGWRQYELVVEDTGGDPVGGALAARKLIRESGVIALVGSLLSSATAAAAVVADAHGVPLVSPTATNERIWELGGGIFQTNLTRMFEARVLARLTGRVLLKRRFAVLYPDTRDGARNYQIFADEVRQLGGEIVGAAAFAPDNTDFRGPLQEIRATRPEVVYIDASVDQMVLIGPQLDFYRLGALVVGPSSWDSPKLLSQAGGIMERTLFPSETALFPPSWTRDFTASWHPEHLPDEATPLALKAFQATRLVLDALSREGIGQRADLARALRARLDDTEFEAHGPEAFAGLVRMFEGEEIVDFPADLYAATWAEPTEPEGGSAGPDGELPDGQRPDEDIPPGEDAPEVEDEDLELGAAPGARSAPAVRGESAGQDEDR